MIPIVVASSLIAVAIVLFLVFQVRTRHGQGGKQMGAVRLTPVDLDAFENLTDPEEEKYLRQNLSPAEFRRVQRLRIRAAKMYVAALSENASTLMAVGQSARFRSSPEIAASGQQIHQAALRLKLWCALSLLRMNTAFVFPTLLSPLNAGAQDYLTVKYMATSLGGKLTV
jgi:hypothetical protein